MNVNIRLACLNVRSLLPKVADLGGLAELHDFHILAVTETWLNSSIDDNAVNINGYNYVRKDRNLRGGGVGIYIKSNISFSVVEVGGDIEQLWVVLKINNSSIIVGVCYRPPQLDHRHFLSELEDALGAFAVRTDSLILCGDTNIDLLKLDTTAAIHLSDLMDSLDITQLIDKPTRTTRYTASLIDHIYTNNLSLVAHADVIDCHLSDHDIVYCEVRLSRPICQPRMATFRNYNAIDSNSFTRDLHLAPFHHILRIPGVDDKANFLRDCILALFDCHAPIISATFTKPPAPWLTDNLKLLMNLRDSAKARYRRTKLTAHWDYYKTLRNLTNSTLKSEKRAYFDYISRSKTNRDLFQQIQYLNVNVKERINIPEHLADVNNINNYFVSSTNGSAALPARSVCGVGGDAFSFHPVEVRAVHNIINNMKSKSVGIDGISLRMLKLCCPVILPYLTHLINICLESETFPSEWKHAIVLPLPKTKQPQSFKDLRPISLLPVMSKVLEKVIHHQITAFVESHHVLPETQSGFRRGYGCETALLCITDDILTARDRGLVTVLVLLDFSKAFDTVDHGVLVSLLRDCGFGVGTVNLIGEFLRGRRQSVQLGARRSSPLPLSAGVPQGSIIGPLLFSLYVRDLSSKMRYCRVHSYADDTQLYLSFVPSEWEAAVRHINRDLESLAEFSLARGLAVNPTKSQVLVMSGPSIRDALKDKINIKLNSTTLPVVDSARNLGLILDNDFRYRQQMNIYIRNAYINLKKLFPHRSILSTKAKTALCEAFILSQFTYCASLYHPAIDKHTEYRIQKIQNSCIRLIFGLRKYDHVSHKLKQLGWLNMWGRRELQTLCLFHKILLSKTPPYLYNRIKYRGDVHSITTRFRGLISPPMHKTSLYKRSFSYVVFSKYNRVPHQLKNKPAEPFRRGLREFVAASM